MEHSNSTRPLFVHLPVSSQSPTHAVYASEEAPIKRIPFDVIENIFTFLNLKQMLALGQVNHFFRAKFLKEESPSQWIETPCPVIISLFMQQIISRTPHSLLYWEEYETLRKIEKCFFHIRIFPSPHLRHMRFGWTFNRQNDTPFESKMKKIIHTIPNLQTLCLKFYKSVNLIHLDQLTALQSLSLPCNIPSVRFIGNLPNLQELDFSNCQKLPDFHLPGLNFPALQNLNLSQCNITDITLRFLSECTTLTTLNLSYCRNITGEGLRALTDLTALTSLSLTGCSQFTDENLSVLTNLTALHTLSVSECPWITDESLIHVGELAQLHNLDLNYCREISDVGLNALVGLRLITLKLVGCPGISDAAKFEWRQRCQVIDIREKRRIITLTSRD